MEKAKWIVRVFVVVLVLFSLPSFGQAVEGGPTDVPFLSLSGPYSGTLSWTLDGIQFQQQTTLNLTQTFVGPNTITGDGYTPYDTNSSVCIYGRNPNYPCSGIQYSYPPNPTCPSTYGPFLFLCNDVGPQHYICHTQATSSSTFTVTNQFTLFQISTMTLYMNPTGTTPCPPVYGPTQPESLNFTPNLAPNADCDNGPCQEDYLVTGTFGGNTVNGEILYNGAE